MVFSNNWKICLISTGVLSIALFCVPNVMDFSVSRAPVIWTSFVSWLRPPYLYLIINGIIISIAASSRLYQNDKVSNITETTPSAVEYDMKVNSHFATVVYEQQLHEGTKDPVFEEKIINGGFSAWTPEKENPLVFEEKIISGGFSAWTPEKEKPLVSARFGHRKPVKASPEGGKKLRVTKPKRQETLETTWKTITEGRAMPLTRHLKKSDTWENHGRHINMDPPPVKKSETFKDRTNCQLPPVNNSPGSASAGKLRKEPSLSHDELNRRVEAFIKKFNDDMRLQRQESLRQYQEMITRGV